MKTWMNVATLVAAMAVGCAPSSAPEPTGHAAQALTKPNQLCVAWGATDADRICEDTTDVAKVHTAGASKSSGKPLTLFVLWPIDEGQEANAEAIRSWFEQARRLDAWLREDSRTSGGGT